MNDQFLSWKSAAGTAEQLVSPAAAGNSLIRPVWLRLQRKGTT